jgi:hypothetical protein
LTEWWKDERRASGKAESTRCVETVCEVSKKDGKSADNSVLEANFKRTYPDNSRVFLKNRCGCFEAKVMLAGETTCYGLKKGVRYGCLSCTGRTPELRDFTAFKATSKGVV